MGRARKYIILDKTKLNSEILTQLRGNRTTSINGKALFPENSLSSLSTYKFLDNPGKLFTILKWREEFTAPDLKEHTSSSLDKYSKIMSYEEVLDHISKFAIAEDIKIKVK